MMRKRISYFLAIIFTVWWTGCEKIDVPDPASPEPVFYADLMIGGEEQSFTAGQDGFEMQANFRRQGQTLDFIGTMKPGDCNSNDCRNSLRFVIRNDRPYNAGAFDPEVMLTPSRLSFRSQFQRDSVSVRFKSPVVNNDAAHKTSWLLDGVNVGDEKDIELTLKTGLNYEVVLKTRQRDCESRQLQTVVLPQGGCRSRIAMKDNRTLRVISNGRRPLTYNWMNESRDSVFPLPAATAANQRNIWVSVTDADGCVSESQIGIKSGIPHLDACVADFEHRASWLPERDKSQWGRVAIQFVDETGMLYTSNFLRQPSDASFEILEVEDFTRNEMGDPTKKLTVSVSCLLYNARTDDEIKMDGTIVLAVAYPKS